MKKLAIVLLLFFTFCNIKAQVNGVIVSDTGKFTIVKIWGTHAERGYAYGYLMGNKIKSLYVNYMRPQIGVSNINTIKQMIADGANISIDANYILEAKGIVSGMVLAGIDTTGINYLDILVANSFLDITAFSGKKGKDIGLGCSGLMSWGDATLGTDLDGKSVISRHLDWTTNSNLLNSMVMVIHLPSEIDEQPWLLIGFAGQMSVLSGNNKNIAVYQHVLGNVTGSNPSLGQQYEPIWFSMRKALEKKDYNGDGANNVNDMRSVFNDHPQGYAGDYIVTALAPYSSGVDSLIALVSEITPVNPKFSFRTNSYPDSIPGDNLYAANYPISRNNAMDFCSRYNGIRSNISNGTNIGSAENWNLLRDFSHQSTNIQLIQFIPEMDILKVSVYKNSHPAYQNAPMIYSLNNLFSSVAGISENNENHPRLYPNPCVNYISIVPAFVSPTLYIIYDYMGKICEQGYCTQTINTSKLLPGIFKIVIKNEKYFSSSAFVKL